MTTPLKTCKPDLPSLERALYKESRYAWAAYTFLKHASGKPAGVDPEKLRQFMKDIWDVIPPDLQEKIREIRKLEKENGTA